MGRAGSERMPQAARPILVAVPAIEAKGLERTFEGGVHAVAGVDLEVAEGEIYAFLGPNGAGKTAVLAALALRGMQRTAI